MNFVKPKANHLFFVIPTILSFVISIVYLTLAEAVWFDDPYIYFQYVRNLVDGNGLVFNSNEISFGMTSILWPLLAALLAYVTQIDVILITQWLSILFFIGSATLLTIIFQRLSMPYIGIFVTSLYVAYPSMAKIAISGMEVGMMLFLLALLILLLLKDTVQVWQLGSLVGLMFLCRPDSAVLVPCCMIWLLLRNRTNNGNLKNLLHELVIFVATCGFIVLPWVTYVFTQIGEPLPSTRVGKLLLWLPVLYDINYQEYSSLNLYKRLLIGFQNLSFFLDFRHIILVLPLASAFLLFKHHYSIKVRLLLLFGLIYSVGLVSLYSMTFPLYTIRYLSGVYIFSFITLTVMGGTFLTKLKDWNISLNKKHMITIASFFTTIAIMFSHYFSFENYLSQVEQQRVRIETGIWLKNHTSPSATVATEPIGALGYYSERYMVDMGGLINIEAQHLMPNGCSSSTELSQFLEQSNPTYLADCSGLCLGKPALERINRDIDLVFASKPSEPSIVGCSIYEIK